MYFNRYPDLKYLSVVEKSINVLLETKSVIRYLNIELFTNCMCIL